MWDRVFNESPRRLTLWLLWLTVRALFAFRWAVEKRRQSHSTQPVWEVCVTSKRLRTRPFFVLLEGWDCAGKKTVARELARLLETSGVSACVHVGPLGAGVLNGMTRLVSRRRFPAWVRSLVYAFDGCGDRLDGVDAQVLIQVSSPIRGWAYALVHGQRWRLCLARRIRARMARYDQIWMLTAPLAVRRARHYIQSAAGINADCIEERFPSEQTARRLDDRLLEELQRTGSFVGLEDTSIANPQDVSTRIANSILRSLRQEAAHYAG